MKKLFIALLLVPMVNAELQSNKKTTPKIPNCELVESLNLGIAEIQKCKNERSEAYQKLWKPVLSGKLLKLTSDDKQYFYLRSDGTLEGKHLSTDTDKKIQLDMNGAWEISSYGRSTLEETYVEFFAGKMQCTYKLSVKSKKFYWLENKKANYSNICPSMLMEAYQPIKD